MAAHLAEQVSRRHEEYLKAEVSSLRNQLNEAQEKLRSVELRLLLVERSISSLDCGAA